MCGMSASYSIVRYCKRCCFRCVECCPYFITLTLYYLISILCLCPVRHVIYVGDLIFDILSMFNTCFTCWSAWVICTAAWTMTW